MVDAGDHPRLNPRPVVTFRSGSSPSHPPAKCNMTRFYILLLVIAAATTGCSSSASALADLQPCPTPDPSPDRPEVDHWGMHRDSLQSAGTTIPELLQRAEVAFSLQRGFPREQAGKSLRATLSLWTLVDPAGTPVRVEVAQSSSYPGVDSAAVNSLRNARYRPAVREGCDTWGWLYVPLAVGIP